LVPGIAGIIVKTLSDIRLRVDVKGLKLRFPRFPRDIPHFELGPIWYGARNVRLKPPF
jgi:hypothetical protein